MLHGQVMEACCSGEQTEAHILFSTLFSPRIYRYRCPRALQAHPEARCLVSGVPGATQSVLPSTSTGPWARLLPALSQGACISPQYSLHAPEDPPCSV